MGKVTVDLPEELIDVFGSEEGAKRGATVAVVLDLVRRGRVSRGRAAELLGMPLAALPALLAQHRIPWFDYSEEDLRRDIETLDPAHGTMT